MAIVRAVKTGNWSDTTVWNTGALPTSADDVYSNTFTVTIDTSPTVLSISNAAATGVTAGGSFVISANGITLTANVVPGSVRCLNVSVTAGNSTSLVGNCTAPNAGVFVVELTGTGMLNATGTYTGGGSSGHALVNSSSGTINVTGNCLGGVGNGSGLYNASTGTANITGNCTGGSASTGHGVTNVSSGVLNVTGTITGGAGATTYGALNNSTGTLTHIGTAQASATTAAIGPGASVGQVTILSGPLLSTDASAGGAAASGVNPVVALRWFPADNALSTFEYRMRGQTATGSPSARPARQLFLPDAYSATYPSAANVRSGTTYGPGSIYSGTCAVPAAASVLFGVPVDATTGTVTITAADIRSALGLSAANLDTQLSGINTAATNAPTNVPPAVRTNLTAELARLSNAATTSEVADIVTAAV